MKNPIRNEHMESYRAGKFDEIPQFVLNLIKEREAKNVQVEKEQEAEQEVASKASKKVTKEV